MSKREFTKVSPNVWRSSRFRKLPNSDAKMLYLYYLTCEHQNSAGCYRIPDLYACADLGWELEHYATARALLIDAQMISLDEENEVIFVHRWFKHCPPMNDKHAQGTERLISEIESDDLREKVEAEFAEAKALRIQKPKAETPLERASGYMRGRS